MAPGWQRWQCPGRPASDGYRPGVKILRAAAAAGIVKKLAAEARKPENQARIKSGADALRSRTRGRRR